MRKLYESPQHVLNAVTKMVSDGNVDDNVLLALIALSFMVRSWDRSLDVNLVAKTAQESAEQTFATMQRIISSGRVPDVQAALAKLKRNPVMIKDMVYVTSRKLDLAYKDADLGAYAGTR